MGTDNKNTKRKTLEQNIRLSYFVVVAIVVVLMFVNYIILKETGGFTWLEFIQETAGNLMGVLAAFLIFDVLHDKLSKDSYAEDISYNISQTIFSQEGLENLSDDTKKKFVIKALESLDKDPVAAKEIASSIDEYWADESHQDDVIRQINRFSTQHKIDLVKENVHSLTPTADEESLVLDFIDTYLTGKSKWNVRTEFEYRFYLGNLPSGEVYDILKHKDNYFNVQEFLLYKIKYLSDDESKNKLKAKRVSIGLPFTNKHLERFLTDSQVDSEGNPLDDCIFRETLDIDPEDIDVLTELSSSKNAEFKKLFTEMFKPDLRIDDHEGKLLSVTADGKGIVASFEIEYDINSKDHNVRIGFHMPKRWNSQLEVAIVDPTKDPKISLNYANDMQVEMFTFLDSGDNISYDNAHFENYGSFNIILNDTWVYPRSGVIFSIEKK